MQKGIAHLFVGHQEGLFQLRVNGMERAEMFTGRAQPSMIQLNSLYYQIIKSSLVAALLNVVQLIFIPNCLIKS